jgi:protein arginine N-methyltransferase 2
MASEIDVDLDTRTQEILLAATNHDLPALKPFLRVPGAAQVQDPETGYTPLHAAIAACEKDSDGEDDVDIEKAKDVIKELFLSGAIWNDLDANGETPGCLAWRIGRQELYELVVEAGVRAEMLMNLMGGYEMLEDDDEGEDEDENQDEDMTGKASEEQDETEKAEIVEVEKKDVNSEDYLASKLTFDNDKLLDDDANGVMMAWETNIMRRSVDLLAPKPGLRILNIGFGMGIIDRMFAATEPESHHIIEAHPAVLEQIKKPDSDFGEKWAAKKPGKFVVHEGKWQDIVQKLLEQGEIFDAIYFDTFGEDYSQLKMFFTEYVVGLLDQEGKFGFFNGLGADRRVCYDVYCKVAELDLCDAGLETEWHDVDVEELGGEGEGEWEGVRRRYWTLEKYRLPICSFMG